MKALASFFSGKKSYLVSIGAIVYAAGINRNWWTHNADVDLVFGGTYGLTLRAAIAKLCQQVVGNGDAPKIAGPPRAAAALSLFLAFSFALPGCTNGPGGPQVQGNAAVTVRNFIQTVEPGLRPGARLACSLYLDYAVTDKDRADLKANIYTVSSIVAGTTGDTSPGDLSKQIQAALPAAKETKELADAVAGGWGVALPFIKGDPALLIKVTQDLAAGCADSTK